MATDILLNTTTLDLQIKNGDFVIGETSSQEANLIIETFLGNWFEHPLCGVGLLNYLGGNETAVFIEQQIKQQLVTDGFTVDSINLKGSTLTKYNINLTAHR